MSNADTAVQALPTNGAPPETAQQRFKRIYITSAEIAQELNVTRPAIMRARKCGLLPDPVDVHANQLYIWERVTVRPYVDAWRTVLHARRSTQGGTHTA